MTIPTGTHRWAHESTFIKCACDNQHKTHTSSDTTTSTAVIAINRPHKVAVFACGAVRVRVCLCVCARVCISFRYPLKRKCVCVLEKHGWVALCRECEFVCEGERECRVGGGWFGGRRLCVCAQIVQDCRNKLTSTVCLHWRCSNRIPARTQTNFHSPK